MATYTVPNLAEVLGAGNAKLLPNSSGGRVRSVAFAFNTDDFAAALVDGDTVVLGRIPVGARITGGYLRHGALGADTTASLGLSGSDGSGQYAPGTSDAPALLLALTAVTNAATIDLAEDGADTGFGVITQKHVDVTLTFDAANPTADRDISGWLQYVID